MPTNSLYLDNIKYTEEKLPPTNIDKILEILDKKDFGTKKEAEIRKILERINNRESSDGERE